MAPLFKAIGIKLLVRNIAHGASNCRPADYCYGSMGGEKADFILWEQSFNCGRDKAIFEYMARAAYWMEAVLYYMASGGVIPQCPKSNVSQLWLRRRSPSLRVSYWHPTIIEAIIELLS